MSNFKDGGSSYPTTTTFLSKPIHRSCPDVSTETPVPECSLYGYNCLPVQQVGKLHKVLRTCQDFFGSRLQGPIIKRTVTYGAKAKENNVLLFRNIKGQPPSKLPLERPQKCQNYIQRLSGTPTIIVRSKLYVNIRTLPLNYRCQAALEIKV